MPKPISTIKNPLTVIAIFAGIAEVSGSAVLPFISEANQQTYIWFLMLFPFALVLLFFITLNWNYKVLYAPSDFENEDNFLNLLHKRESLVVEQTVDDVDEEINPGVLDFDANEIFKSHDVLDFNKTDRERRMRVESMLFRARRDEARMAEDLVFKKLSRDLGQNFQRELSLSLDGMDFRLDAAIATENSLNAFDIKYHRRISSGFFNSRRFEDQISRYRHIYERLSDSKKLGFKVTFVLVSDEINNEAMQRLEDLLSNMPFKTDIISFEFDELINDCRKAS
ncbi:MULTISPECIES: hypothetical protein [Kangiella]|uniref:Uncharacterized protein n=1 Tax=Kangiella koreensis (strain DSM 16069 / JCM 12317 / KCTC 12182 / SW-125) TaxID=523791 RepID=C7RBM7_KANKD|nr:hypothetical protein [Kangiella koreensis]ACV26669.1 hypothetical protein Kkor_1250 [Kangiella koreensis DSM 16069]